MYADAQNEFEIPGRTLVGLTEQWTSNDGNTYVTVWGKNLTDEEYDVSLSLLTPVGLVGNPGAPLTYGVTIGRRF
jgi:outer membrane receptor protein involved in Fe transport